MSVIIENISTTGGWCGMPLQFFQRNLIDLGNKFIITRKKTNNMYIITIASSRTNRRRDRTNYYNINYAMHTRISHNIYIYTYYISYLYNISKYIILNN